MPRAARSTNKVKGPIDPNKEPTVRRERSLRACTRCRQRKQKCDNTLPHCSNCVKGGVPCEAFPINVASRDNLLQIYDLLQESTRRNSILEKELSLARVVVPDFLAVFSAFIAQQIGKTPFIPCHVSPWRLLDSMSFEAADHLLPLPKSKMIATEINTKQGAATTSASGAGSQPSDTHPDIWRTIQLLQDSFPAVSPAISAAAEQLDRDMCVANLVDLAAVPVRDLQHLLSDSTTPSSGASPRRSIVEAGLSLEELTSRVFAASETTKIAATLLWALLALAQHRGEELMQMDLALTCFMQSWQAGIASASGTFFAQDPITISYRRAYDWVHLQTAVITGKLHVLMTTTSGLRGIGEMDTNTDFTDFIASVHVEQKRLEYVALHLFLSPVGGVTDAQHEEAVWNLLSSLKSLSDVSSQAFESFGVSHDSTAISERTLMRQKLEMQLYGMFPRMLFMHCPNERRLWRWLNNALPLATTALSCHHAAWMQYSWLGDHAVDALTFADLLAAFAWALQQCRSQNDMRNPVFDHLRIGIELGDRFADRWPQYRPMIQKAIGNLRALQETAVTSSGLSTPWSSASVATAPTESSSILRTPQAHEMPQPSHPHPDDLHQYFQSDPRQTHLHYAPPINDPSHPHRYPQSDPKQGQPATDWQGPQLQLMQSDWSNREGLALNSFGTGVGGQQLPIVPLLDVDLQQRKEGASAYTQSMTSEGQWQAASRTTSAIRSLPNVTSSTLPQQQQPAPTTGKTFIYMDERGVDGKS